MISVIENAPLVDDCTHCPNKIIFGFWSLTPNAYYRDAFSEYRELCVYIAAKCSSCQAVLPYCDVVYSKVLEVPDGEELTYEWDLENEKKKALREFEENPRYNSKDRFTRYCPNCGACMTGVKTIVFNDDTRADVKEAANCVE